MYDFDYKSRLEQIGYVSFVCFYCMEFRAYTNYPSRFLTYAKGDLAEPFGIFKDCFF